MTRRRVRDAGASRLTGPDLLRAGSLGLRTRRVRAALSALGISIGIAAIVGVLGISQSSESLLLAELGRLGNLLTVQAGSNASGQQTELPDTAERHGVADRAGHRRGARSPASPASTCTAPRSSRPCRPAASR